MKTYDKSLITRTNIPFNLPEIATARSHIASCYNLSQSCIRLLKLNACEVERLAFIILHYFLLYSLMALRGSLRHKNWTKSYYIKCSSFIPIKHNHFST